MAEGYGVQLAKNVQEVLKKVYHTEALDLLILDPDLPGTDKLFLLKKLQNRIPALPVVVHIGFRPCRWSFTRILQIITTTPMN